MKKAKISFGIENVLVIIAILMILTATFAPQFAKSRNAPNSGAKAVQSETLSPSR